MWSEGDFSFPKVFKTCLYFYAEEKELAERMNPKVSEATPIHVL